MQFEAPELFKFMETRALIPMVLIQRVALTCTWKFHPSVASIPLLLLRPSQQLASSLRAVRCKKTSRAINLLT